MLEPRVITEKNLNKETHRLIGQVQLQRYGSFLETYNTQLNLFKKKLSNNLYVRNEPVSVEFKPYEDITLLQLIHSDNKLLSRILISLASICNEINLLVSEAQNDYYSTFVFYGEDQGKGIENLEKISKLTELLQKVGCFVRRSQQVIILLLRQLCALLGKGFYTGSSTSCFPEPIDCLAEMLVCLITLDCLLSRQVIKEHWSLYKRAVRSMLHSPSQFNISADNLRNLYRCLIDIDNELLSGTILQHTLEKCIDESLINTVKSCSLANEFTLYVHQMLSELERDDENISFTQIWLQANALFVFQYNLFGGVDKKILKRVLDVNKKAIACTIFGNILWYPEQFLLKHVPMLMKNLDEKTLANHRTAQIATRSQNLSKDAHSLCLQACLWIIEIEKITKQDMCRFNIRHLQDTCSLLIDGMKLIKKISEVVKWITNLHAGEGRPMAKSVLLSLCRLIEVLRSFRFIFNKNLLPLTYVILLIIQHLNHKALTILASLKKSVTQEKSYKEQHLDVLSALVVAEHSLNGPCTGQRILITKLALSASGLSSETLLEIRSVISRLELISNIGYLLQRLCNCSFLYWHQGLLPVYFSKLLQSRTDLSCCCLLLSALSDCTGISDKFIKSAQDQLKTNLTNVLTQSVETNLRLQTHLHLQLPLSDPFQNPPPQTFKKIFPILFSKEYINIKQEVEHYLSTIFYNLTTVVLHDWRTYGEMRRLAMVQYGLDTVESNLPMQTLEQGLDVLEIMRNINVFVGKYLYNLNNQLFVEEWSNNKHLNTINISHVANSIRTHGIGIMNTTVNFTYQFLRNKFYIFSQFMFDEHIKSRVLRDLRFFSEHKVDLRQRYPYDRAEKFNLDIRKLGLNSNGQSYLDLFRKLITHIGNAMGYIRLVRSGGRRCLADATCFIPDLKGIYDFNNFLDDVELPEITKKAANCFKRDIKILVDNFEEATEYFKLLVKVFAPVFRNPQNIHLRNFYMIVPPLTINFIEHSLTSKERLNKKNRVGAAFTDDGFAMGLAYIIELLEQSSQLNSLHWFESVKMKLANDREKNVESQKSSSNKDDEKLQQTLTLTEKRINAFDKEFQLLYYSFSSARIFFQS